MLLNQPKDEFLVAHILFNFGYLTIKKVRDDGIVELEPLNKQINLLLLSDYVTNILKFTTNSVAYDDAKEKVMKGDIATILNFQNQYITALPYYQRDEIFHK